MSPSICDRDELGTGAAQEGRFSRNSWSEKCQQVNPQVDDHDWIGHHRLVREKDGTWYRRFAEVPGVGYEGDLNLRARLPASNAVPKVERYLFDGRRIVSLTWQHESGSSSASPAHGLAFGSWSDLASDGIRERVLSALELPGLSSDYHFAMQCAAEALWKRRREEPWLVAFVEWLYWWDVRLVEAHPHIIEIEPGKKQYVRVLAFEWIVCLYEREGFLHEALAAAERFAPFTGDVDSVKDLRDRVRQLLDEHA